ncbi:MAG: hypothetical protein LBP39_01125, partial [Rickettsiales bacterium]|nr:hypothetical protein [Rickettsiales bacterium]
MDLSERKEIFKSLYEDVDGHNISRIGRSSVDESERKFLIYGEMPVDELIALMNIPAIANDVKEAKVFYDLGSGTGKVVIGVALMFPNIEKVFGIELVKTLYESSEQVKEKLSQLDKKAAMRANFINDNFFNVDFSNPFSADI